MRNSLKTGLVLFWVPLSLVLASVNVKVTLDSTRVTLGDWVHVTWQIKHSPEDTLLTPEIPQRWGAFEILSHDFETEANQAQLRLTVAVYDSLGELQFAPLPMVVKRKGRGDTLRFPGFRLEVVSVLSAQDTTFRPLKDLHPVEIPWDWRYWLAALVALAAVGGLGYLLWKKLRNRKQKAPEYVPPEKAHEWALRQLSKLKRSDLLERGKVKAYYSELSAILRGYLEKRYLLPALEMTTTEILDNLARVEPQALHQGQLVELLRRADLVKFARYIPPQEQLLQDHTAAVSFVKATKLELVLDDTSPEKNNSKNVDTIDKNPISNGAQTSSHVEQKEVDW